MKLNIVINKEVNNIINQLAANMGTSKRNVISFALSSILEKKVTKNELDELKENIHLSYATTVTVNDEFNKKLDAVNRFGLSKWKFYGYLICDYFYEQQNELFVTKKSIDNDQDYVVFQLDKKQKEKIQQIAEAKSVTVNSLFIHYILNQELEMQLLHQEKNPDTLKVNMTKQIKKVLDEKVKKNNVSRPFYLQQIAAKIEIDSKL